MADAVADFLNAGTADTQDNSGASNDAVHSFLSSGSQSLPEQQQSSGYIDKFLEGLKRFHNAVGEEDKFSTAPKALGETLLAGATQFPLSVARHSIQEGAYLSGQSDQQAARTANRLIPITGYEPKTEAGKGLTEASSAVFQPFADMGSWAAQQAGMSSSAQNLIGDLTAMKGGELTAKATNKIGDAVLDKISGARPADVQPGGAAPQPEPQAAQPAGNGLSPAERQAILQRIGLDRVRQSSLNGDELAGATEAQMARFDEPAGYAAKEQFNAERQALQGHAENMIRDTGGSIGMDERTLNARGQTIAEPFDALRNYFDSATNALYKAADQRSQGAPQTSLDKFGELINTASQFEGKAENGALGRGIRAYLKEQGIMDKDGNMQPISVQQAEALKQYINSQWSPQTSGLAGKIKGAIDKDVTQSAGEDIYNDARQLYRLKKQTLDNPSGIAKLTDFDPQTPINRSVPFQKLPDMVSKLSPDQFNHVLDVLDKVPPEIRPAAQNAVAEIKGHFLNNLLESGNKYETKWSPRGVSREIANNTAKYDALFSSDELARIKDLQDAGDILNVNSAYPGAAAQAANALKVGMMSRLVGGAATGVGAAIGGGVAGPAGASVGGFVGREIGNRAANYIGEEGAVRRFLTRLKDIAPDQPRK